MVWFQINWQTGAVTEHWYKRRVISYDEHADLTALEQRVRQLNAQHKRDKEIATILNEEGFQTTKGGPFDGNTVWLLRQRWQLAPAKSHGFTPLQWEDGSYSVEGVADLFDVHTSTVYKWLKQGKIQGQQLGKGLPWKIPLSPDQLSTWRDYVSQNRRPKKYASN